MEDLISKRLKRLLIFIVAYHAENTIEKVLRRVPADLSARYDVEILIIDDGSSDRTFAAAVNEEFSGRIPFKITTLYNPNNLGYGGNQKIGYHYAIQNGFDYVVLLHGDGQYAPEMIAGMVEPLRAGTADAVFGSRMMTRFGALNGGMPYYKFAGNRILTWIQNCLLGTKLSEFHSGYRAYSVKALSQIPFERNANVFHFDTEIIIQLVIAQKRIHEIPIPTYYGDEICRVDGMKYAKDVLKSTLQARLQKVNLFYDSRFDCEPGDVGGRYPSKLEFDSTHSRVLEIIPDGARVLDLGSGLGAVGAALKSEKNCFVVGCDIARGPLTGSFDKFQIADLDSGLPKLEDQRYDYILLLDVIEHLKRPNEFLDELRSHAAKSGAKVILTTANVAFIIMRISLAMGRFEYGKRGILDITHTRLFTNKTLRRTVISAGFDVDVVEGVVVPLPFVFGFSRLSKMLLAINKWLVKVWPSMFGFQLLMVMSPRPTVDTLLKSAILSAQEKRPGIIMRLEGTQTGT